VTVKRSPCSAGRDRIARWSFAGEKNVGFSKQPEVAVIAFVRDEFGGDSMSARRRVMRGMDAAEIAGRESCVW
jgi:hypothetical protein